MRRSLLAPRLLLGAALAVAAPLAAAQMQPPMTPDLAQAMRQAQPDLFKAGQSDVFEISTSQMALQKSRDPAVRAFATMLIDHHSRTTNLALAAARTAGVTPPPPVLDARQRGMIDQLMAAPTAEFDRTFLSQQVPAHQEALALHSGYAQGGDTPQLRTVAQSAVLIVQGHLERAQQLLGGAR